MSSEVRSVVARIAVLMALGSDLSDAPTSPSGRDAYQDLGTRMGNILSPTALNGSDYQDLSKGANGDRAGDLLLADWIGA